MRLITGQTGQYHVSLETVMEFEKAILADKRVRPVKTSRRCVSRAAYFASRSVAKMSRHTVYPIRTVLPWPMGRRVHRDYFTVLMGLDFLKCLPHFIFPGRKSLYMFDAWPDVHDRIRAIVGSWEVDNVFLSSLMAAERLRISSNRCRFFWIPEGVDSDLYRHCPYADKDIDVLQLGRRYDAFHDSIVSSLEQSNRVYLYEKVKGEIIFPTKDSFIDGLARSKVSICVPSSITHPARSGDIETMTTKYLQSMLSKCLILGHAPTEMISLFGYNPVIEIDMHDPVKQIHFVLDHLEDYVPLIERNHVMVKEHHTWRHRWETIASILFSQAAGA